MRSIIIVVNIILLCALLCAQPISSAYVGEIEAAVIDSWEWQPTEAWTNGRYSLLRLNDTNMFVTCAWGSTGTDKRGWLRTFSIYPDNGTIRNEVIDSWNYGATGDNDGEYAQIKHIAGTDMYLLFWRGEGNYNQLGTVRIYENGTIQNSFISKKTMVYKGFARHIDNLTARLWALVYSADDSEDGMLETWYVYNNNGTIVSTANDTVEFDTVFAGTPSFITIDDDTIAILYSNISAAGDWTIATYNISLSTGAITEPFADYWTFSSDVYGSAQIWSIGANTCLVAYTDSGYDVHASTLSIANNGTITKSFIDTLKVIDANVAAETVGLTLFAIAEPSIYDDGVLGVTVRGIGAAEYDGYLYTFNVSSAGTLDAAYADMIEFETTGIVSFTGVQYIANDYYVIVYTEFTSKDGFMCTIEINTTEVAVIPEATNWSAWDSWWTISVPEWEAWDGWWTISVPEWGAWDGWWTIHVREPAWAPWDPWWRIDRAGCNFTCTFVSVENVSYSRPTYTETHYTYWFNSTAADSGNSYHNWKIDDYSAQSKNITYTFVINWADITADYVNYTIQHTVEDGLTGYSERVTRVLTIREFTTIVEPMLEFPTELFIVLIAVIIFIVLAYVIVNMLEGTMKKGFGK
jgi:hypothetical protein